MVSSVIFKVIGIYEKTDNKFFFCFFFSVDGGHRAVIFDRFSGVKKQVIGEGTHFFIPWVQKPIIFDVRSRPRNVPVITGSKGNYSRYSQNELYCLHFWVWYIYILGKCVIIFMFNNDGVY